MLPLLDDSVMNKFSSLFVCQPCFRTVTSVNATLLGNIGTRNGLFEKGGLS